MTLLKISFKTCLFLLVNMKRISYKFLSFGLALALSFSCFLSASTSAYALEDNLTDNDSQLDMFWNTGVSPWENLCVYAKAIRQMSGMVLSPNIATEIWGVNAIADFAEFMRSDGYSEEEITAWTSTNVQDSTTYKHLCPARHIHGGGGASREVTIDDELVDIVLRYTKQALDTNCGYWIAKTLKPTDLPVEYFSTKDRRDNFIATVNNLEMVFVTIPINRPSESSWYLCLCTSTNLISNYYNRNSFIDTEGYFLGCIEDDWSVHFPEIIYPVEHTNTQYGFIGTVLTLSNIELKKNGSYDFAYGKQSNWPCNLNYYNDLHSTHRLQALITKDGRNVKIWKNLDNFKQFDIGQQPYYITDSFNTIYNSTDKSITMTETTYNNMIDNSTVNNYDIIQNNITNNNGSDLTEDDIQKIVEDTMRDILDDYNKPTDNPSGDNGGTSSGGNGIGDFIDGLGGLLDFLLSLFGRVIGLISGFLNSALDLLSTFTTFTDGFASFLTSAFGFMPPEAISAITSGILLLISLAIIKFFKG